MRKARGAAAAAPRAHASAAAALPLGERSQRLERVGRERARGDRIAALLVDRDAAMLDLVV